MLHLDIHWRRSQYISMCAGGVCEKLYVELQSVMSWVKAPCWPSITHLHIVIARFEEMWLVEVNVENTAYTYS